MDVRKLEELNGHFITSDYITSHGIMSKYMLKDFLDNLPPWFVVVEIGRKYIFPKQYIDFMIEWRKASEDAEDGKRAEWKKTFWNDDRKEKMEAIISGYNW